MFALIVFTHFLLVLAALALIIALIDRARGVAHRLGIDAIELLLRYKSVGLDVEQRRINHDAARLMQERGRLEIQNQRRLLRGTPGEYDVEIEVMK